MKNLSNIVICRNEIFNFSLRLKQKEALRICTCYSRLHLPLIDWNISRQHNNHGITNWLKIISRERCLFFKLLSQAWVKEKILSPHEGLKIFETQKFFFVSCSWQDKNTSFPTSLLGSKLAISLILLKS